MASIMKTNDFNTWKRQIFSQLNKVQEKIGEADFKRLNLDIICRALNKVTPFVNEDDQIDVLKRLVDRSISLIPNNTSTLTKTNLKPYYKSIRTLKSYLKRNYRLVPVGYHSIIWTIIGIGFGIPYSFFITSLLGIFIGLGIGLGIGTYFDKKAEKENKSY